MAKPEVRKVQQIDNTLFISIPKQNAKELGIEKGDSLRIDVENKNIVMSHLE